MKDAKITYGVGDIVTGTFKEYETFESAKMAKEYGECIGGFHCIIKRTVTYDEDGDIESIELSPIDDEEVIEGGDYDIENMA